MGVWAMDGDDWSCAETLGGHESTVWCIAFDNAGARFATASSDKTIRIWKPANKISHREIANASSLLSAAYVGPLFRSAVEKPRLIAEPPADASCPWVCVSTIQGHHRRCIFSVDWLPFTVGNCDATIVSGCGDDMVRVFQPENEASLSGWTCVASVVAHAGDVHTVGWCPKSFRKGSAIVASAGDDKDIALWEFHL